VGCNLAHAYAAGNVCWRVQEAGAALCDALIDLMFPNAAQREAMLAHPCPINDRPNVLADQVPSHLTLLLP
jgi:hypothetical protein